VSAARRQEPPSSQPAGGSSEPQAILPAASFVPHRPPMLWIDDVIAHDDETIVCRVTLRDDHVFLDGGQAESVIIVELMAQSVAAFVGLADHKRGGVPRPGYLVAIPEARFFVPTVTSGQTIEITCARRFGDDKIASFSCVARHQNVALAEAIINVVRPGALV
jgi:predicted hotdog family 3-hydroxylacyl-ACP dehydratase